MTNDEIKDMYLEMGIDLNELGCIMLEVEKLTVSDVVPEEELYFSGSAKFAQGIVCEWKEPHVTLLFGLMQKGQTWRKYVDMLIEDIDLTKIKINEVITFDNVMDGDEVSIYVGEVEPTEELIKANAELRRLSHIDTFVDYKPHITLFYAKRNDEIKQDLLNELNERFAGKSISTGGLDYGS
jgi:2'-5' RNA ligase